MGNKTGFLEIERRDRGYAPAAERIRNYKEFVIPLSEEATRDQAARCMDCGIPFCHNGCPVNNQIPDWNDLVYHGNWEEASRNLHSTNNFPEFTGRICPAPCQESCTLNLNDQPVTIKTIECAIVDRAYANGWIKPEVFGKPDRQERCGDRLRAGRPRPVPSNSRVRATRCMSTRRMPRPAACCAMASRTSRWIKG